MSVAVERIKLPVPTNATKAGPVIEYRHPGLSLEYDYEDANGTVKWGSLIFADVLAYDVCASIVCSAENIIPSDIVQIRKDSSWLAQIVERWQVSVGWQQYQHGLGGRNRFKHYLIYFDDVCAVQIIAADCTVRFSPNR